MGLDVDASIGTCWRMLPAQGLQELHAPDNKLTTLQGLRMALGTLDVRLREGGSGGAGETRRGRGAGARGGMRQSCRWDTGSLEDGKEPSRESWCKAALEVRYSEAAVLVGYSERWDMQSSPPPHALLALTLRFSMCRPTLCPL